MMDEESKIVVLKDNQIRTEYCTGFDIMFYLREDIAQWLTERNIQFSWKCFDKGEGYIKFEQKSDAMAFKLTWM